MIERLIGEGGNKRVYLARDSELNRKAAVGIIKIEGMGEAGRERIQREIQAMGRLSAHPNIVSIFDADEEDGLPYLVCQYMEGGSLADELERSGRLAAGRTIELARQVTSALAHAHSKGILHRDLKPENVWLTSDGQAKLGDFGLALIADRTRITTDDTVMGTVAYMAPEVASGGGRSADERSDLYSLGALMYETLASAPPFTGSTQSVILKHISTAPTALTRENPEVPRALETLVHQLLAKSPDERPTSADAVAEQLEALATAIRGESGASVPGDAALSRGSGLSAGLTGSGFVGRDQEMAILRKAVDDAEAGRGSIALLAGEPGIGKSRLAEELASYSELRGLEVLQGQCFEAEGAPAFWLWTQVIRQVLEGLAGQAPRILGSDAAYVAQLVPEAADIGSTVPELPALGADEARFRVFEAVAQTLQRTGDIKPLLVILEDLQRADKSSLLLLEFLARRLDKSRVLVVGTFRDVELGKSHPLNDVLADLAAERNFQRIQLEGLTEPDVADFITKSTRADAADSLVSTIYRETEGNPFFVQEIVQLLIADGRLGLNSQHGESSEWSVVIPQGVRDTLRQRLARVREETAKVLSLASVIGREFALRTVGDSGQTKGDALIDLLEEACESGLVVEDESRPGAYRFSHALIRETLYDEVSAARRVGFHRSIAEALESQYGKNIEGHLTELAYHFGQAVPVLGSEKAIDYGRRAAEKMMEMIAFGEAVTQYRSILAVADDDDDLSDADNCDLLIALADAEDKSGETAASKATARLAADLAIEMRDGERVADAALILAGFAGEFGNLNTDFVGYAKDALSLLGPEDSVLKVRLLARLLVEQGWSDPSGVTGEIEAARIQKADEIVAMAERVGDERALGHALHSKINAMVRPKFRRERLELTNRMIAMAESAGDVGIVQIGQVCRVVSHIELGDLSALDNDIMTLSERAERFRDPFMLFFRQVMYGMREHLRGNLDAAEVHAQETLRIGQETGQTNAMLTWGIQIASIRNEQARGLELVPTYQAFRSQFPDIVVWRTALAQAYAENGQLERAGEHYEFFASAGFANLPDDLNWLTGMTGLARAAAALEDEQGAKQIHDALMPYEDFVGAMGLGSICTGPVARDLALTARTARLFDESISHSEVALEKCRALAAPLYEAHVREELAFTYLARALDGDSDRARTALEDAAGLYRDLGIDHAADRVEDLLAGIS